MAIFFISLLDNDSYSFGHNGGVRCPRCKAVLSKTPADAKGVVLVKRGLDLSCTYDGVDICSRRFRQLYEENAWSGLTFQQLDRHPEFFAFAADAAVAFDVERRETRFEDGCPECGNWGAVAGATPVFLVACTDIPARAFRRTDVEFGSLTEWGLDERQALLLCGDAVAIDLQTAGLSGIDSIAPLAPPQTSA